MIVMNRRTWKVKVVSDCQPPKYFGLKFSVFIFSHFHDLQLFNCCFSICFVFFYQYSKCPQLGLVEGEFSIRG